MNAWVINRDKKIFGEDSNAFRPERWMEDSERVGHMSMFYQCTICFWALSNIAQNVYFSVSVLGRDSASEDVSLVNCEIGIDVLANPLGTRHCMA